MLDRYTERDEYGNADIIGVDSADLQLNLDFDDMNRVTEALNRFADLEEKLERGEYIALPLQIGNKTVKFENREYCIAYKNGYTYNGSNTIVTTGERSDTNA